MKYRTIVADPPWPMPTTGKTKGGRVAEGTWWSRDRGASVALPYETMALDKIEALPVSDLAEDHAHLYLWTTNRFLRDTYQIAESWGFKFSTLLTWCKTPMGLGFGGAFSITTEFVLFCRRGQLAPLERHDSTWLEWSRPYENGHIAHSAKPDAFLDLVEKVSPGPRVELFARRARFGWDYWGNESLGTAKVEA